ncbi:MAG: translation elongation factor Ts [Sediminibacterium sp.]|nr:translation elongation factor Ts [Sediminibacterium sp.]
MSNITASDINNLRKVTGAGMLDCKKALTETNGNFEDAIDWLRKHGQKVAAKRSDREAKEGVILASTANNNTVGYIICVSCETDFVAKNTDFVAFAQTIMQACINNNVLNIEQLNNTKIGDALIQDLINDKLASIGEKIGISKFVRVEAPFVSSYIHGANRMGVLVTLSAEEDEIGKNLAMQIAAMNPVAVDANDVPTEVVERERNIIIDTMKADPKMEGKTDEMLHKISEGKLTAFFKEQTLLAQSFVKDNSVTVQDYIKSKNPTLKVIGFNRVALG